MSSGAPKNSSYGLKAAETAMLGQNRGDEASEMPPNCLSVNPDSRSRAQAVRASTLEKEPGSTNVSYLQ